VFAHGMRGAESRSLLATDVVAGTGSTVRGQSWVAGNIIGRDHGAGSDATITVLGSSHDAATGMRQFNTQFTVSVNFATTNVVRLDSAAALTTDALDIGGRVTAFGTLTGTALDASGTAATHGIVRMQMTTVLGTATGPASNNVLTINASRFDRVDVSQCNFTVGGTAEADPHAYTIDVTGLSTTGIDTGLGVRVSGWVNPVGIATDSNFTAVSLTERTSDAGSLLCEWSPASAQAISASNSSQITLDISQATTKTVDNGVAQATLTTIPSPTIAPLEALGFYVITQNNTSEMHLQFGEFVTALQTHLGAGAMVRRVSAGGRFSATTQAMAALTVTIVLE
jgi:hypothetical protein